MKYWEYLKLTAQQNNKSAAMKTKLIHCYCSTLMNQDIFFKYYQRNYLGHQRTIQIYKIWKRITHASLIPNSVRQYIKNNTLCVLD